LKNSTSHMRSFLLIIALLFLQQTSFAQDALVYDSSQVQVRMLNAEKMNAYKADRDFQYERYTEPPKSLWDRFWDWFWNKINQLLSTRGGSAAFQTILIVLAVAILVFFILKLTGMTKVGLFGRKTGSGLDYAESEENIHTINFDEAIENAVAVGNLRLAVRLLYLQTLKKLADNGFINWQLNKTNIAYVAELGTTAFSNLTLQFESNWYGDIPIDAAEFNAVREQFNQFNRQLI
jgi:hypothetical protein